MPNLWHRERGPVELARRSLGEIENGSLYHWASQLSVKIAECILIVLAHAAVAEGCYEMSCCRGDFATKRFELASLPIPSELRMRARRLVLHTGIIDSSSDEANEALLLAPDQLWVCSLAMKKEKLNSRWR